MKSILLRTIIIACILLFFSFIIGYNILAVREGFQEGAKNKETAAPTTAAPTTAAPTTVAPTTVAPIDYKKFAKKCSTDTIEALKFVIVNKLVENDSDIEYIITNTNSAILNSTKTSKETKASTKQITRAKDTAKNQIDVVKKIADVLAARKDDVSDYIKKENLNATYTVPSSMSTKSPEIAAEMFVAISETINTVNQNMEKIKGYILSRNTIPASTGTSIKAAELASSVQAS